LRVAVAPGTLFQELRLIGHSCRTFLKSQIRISKSEIRNNIQVSMLKIRNNRGREPWPDRFEVRMAVAQIPFCPSIPPQAGLGTGLRAIRGLLFLFHTDTYSVIPADAGIQLPSGCRIKSGMTIGGTKA
jgi:hypothetical protein